MSALGLAAGFAVFGSVMGFCSWIAMCVLWSRIDAINHRIDRAVSAARQRRDHRGRFTK